MISAIGEEKAKCYDRRGASVPRGTHLHWEGHATSGRSPGRTSALDDFSNLNLPESVNRGVACSLYQGALETLRSVANPSPAGLGSASTQKGDRMVLSVRDAGVGFPIPFARRFARVTARPRTAIDPIKIPPRWKNIPGEGAHLHQGD